MCGRNSVKISKEKLEKEYGVKTNQSKFNGSYNIAPRDQQPIVGKNSPKWVKDATFGFIPEWTDEIQEWKKKGVINARSETVEEKNLFQEAVDSQRCLVPSTGFYEWKGSRGSKQPFHITWKNKELMSFAGIYTEYEKGKYSFAILTQEPNQKISKYHDRMPCILTKSNEKAWLNGELKPIRINKLDSDQLKIYPVSRNVNNPDFDKSKCIEKKQGLEGF